MVATAVRILSLANQLASCSRSVTLDFKEGEEGTMGYLNRIGFFDCLSTDVEVLPQRPLLSGAELYRGNNSGVVEIQRIKADSRERGLQSKLSEALGRSYSGPNNKEVLEGATWTIFSELIDNIYSHSDTTLDGYAALQVYQGGNKATVIVADSGLGIMRTLRPALERESSKFAALNDVQLLIEIFRQGISRHGSARGCGLKGCAEKAMKFKADLEVRLANCRASLKPGKQGHYTNKAYWADDLPLLWGTHISFDFHLDAPF